MPESAPLTILRKLLPYTSVLLVIALAYAGWTVFSRWRDNRQGEAEAQAAEARRAAAVTRMTGGGELKILGFYASPGTVKAGEKALVCYSVANASAVRIEPRIDDIKPSLSRCLEVHPQANTSYTLVAQDARGKHVEASFLLQVLK